MTAGAVRAEPAAGTETAGQRLEPGAHARDGLDGVKLMVEGIEPRRVRKMVDKLVCREPPYGQCQWQS